MIMLILHRMELEDWDNVRTRLVKIFIKQSHMINLNIMNQNIIKPNMINLNIINLNIIKPNIINLNMIDLNIINLNIARIANAVS